MKIIDESLLDQFRTAGRCEHCGVYCSKREPHHAFCRGSGRLDIRINLVALGSTRKRQCCCHRRAEEIGQAAFLEIIAAREGVTVQEIIDEVHRLRRLPQPFEVKQPKPKRKRSKWHAIAAERRRKRNRELYQWLKAKRKREKGR